MWEIQVSSMITIPVMIFVLEPYYLVFNEPILYRLVFADFSVFFTLNLQKMSCIWHNYMVLYYQRTGPAGSVFYREHLMLSLKPARA